MLPCHQAELQRFFQEVRRPIWEGRCERGRYDGGDGEGAQDDLVKYGRFDYTQFSELELRCYILIKARLASMYELQEVYTLDQALKLYALYEMELDIEKGRADEMERRARA